MAEFLHNLGADLSAIALDILADNGVHRIDMCADDLEFAIADLFALFHEFRQKITVDIISS